MATKYGPYTPVRRAGSTYYISGQVGVDPATGQAEPDVAGQTSQALTNLAAAMKDAGLQPADVVKATVFLRHMDDFAAINQLYQEFFTEPRPARSCVEVSGLPRVAEHELLIEIEAVAYKRSERTHV